MGFILNVTSHACGHCIVNIIFKVYLNPLVSFKITKTLGAGVPCNFKYLMVTESKKHFQAA